MFTKKVNVQMDENKFLQLIKKDGLLGILIALLIYFGTALQSNQTELSKQLMNIKIKLVQIENKMVDTTQVESMIEKALQNHEKLFHNTNTNSN